jgi:hypothetical protein
VSCKHCLLNRVCSLSIVCCRFFPISDRQLLVWETPELAELKVQFLHAHERFITLVFVVDIILYRSSL